MHAGHFKGMITSTYLDKESNEKVEVEIPTPRFLESRGP